MILKKKKSYFEEEVGKNKNKPKELWKTLKSLGLNWDKARQSKIALNKDGAIQFEALKNARYFQKVLVWIRRRPPRNIAKSNQQIYKSNNQKLIHKDFMQRIPMTLNFQAYLKKMLKTFYLASIPVKPLNWPNTSKISEERCWGIGSSFGKYNKFINKIINLPRGV